MDTKTLVKYKARTVIIKAMSHPTRLLIVDQFSKKERSVNELTEMVDDDVSTISKHPAVLRNAGIVRDERRGAQVFYYLKVPCILNFFGCVEQVLRTTADEHLRVIKIR